MKIRNRTILAFVIGYFWCWVQPIRAGVIQAASKSLFQKSMELLKIGSMKMEVQNNAYAYVFRSREEIDHLLETMGDLIDKVGQVSVADFKEFIGAEPEEIEATWGWKKLTGFTSYQTREGWKLTVPTPIKLVL